MLKNLGNLLAIIFLIILIIRKNYNFFFSMCFVYLFIVPPFKIKSFYISNIYLLLVILFFVLIINKARKINKFSIFYFFSIFVIILISVIGWVVNGHIAIKGFIPIIGNLKGAFFILLISILFNEFKMRKCLLDLDKIMDKFILIIIMSNFLAVLLQIYFPDFSTSFFYDLYWTPQVTPLQNFVRRGFFSRMTGTFPSSVNFGVMFLIIWSYLFSKFIFNGDRKSLYYLFLTLFVGLSSLSKTFILGIFLVVFFVIIISSIFGQLSLKYFFKNAIFVISFILIFGISFLFLSAKGAYVEYYFNYILNPIKALSSRYSTNINTSLAKTYKVILEHPIIGVGFLSIDGEFIGDSSYIKLLHQGGFIAFILLFIVISIIGMYLLSKGKFIRLSVLISICLGGLALPIVISSQLTIPFWFYILNKS